MALHDDRTFVRHFSWVIVGLVGITIFFIFLSFLIVGLTGTDSHTGYTYTKYVEAHAAINQARAAASAQPAAEGGTAPGTAVAVAVPVTGGGGAKLAAGTGPNGRAIWEAHCAACHATGAGGAPKIGDKSAWGPILAKTDLQTLYDHAINGFHGELGFMPAKGGATDLSDAEVEAAVKYMVDQSH
ncbi:MAG: c-type cytochrome [Gammaproteobacteria bacterium]